MWSAHIDTRRELYKDDYKDILCSRVYVFAAVYESNRGDHQRKSSAILEAVDEIEAFREYSKTGIDVRGLVSAPWKGFADRNIREPSKMWGQVIIEPPDKLLESVGMDMGSYYRYAASKYDLPVELFYKDTEYENLQ